jgi:hypothetical protein
MSRAKPQRRKEMQKSRAGGKRYALKNLKIPVFFSFTLCGLAALREEGFRGF